MVEHVKHVLDSYKSLMGMLGYDVTKKGLYLFVSLAEEVRDLLKEEKSHAEILEMLLFFFFWQPSCQFIGICGIILY